MGNVFVIIIPVLLLLLLYVIPIAVIVLLLRWIWTIKRNSANQISQNQQIIELLKEIRDKESKKEAGEPSP